MKSIRTYILLSVTGVMLFFTFITAVWLYRYTYAHLSTLYDTQLVDSARTLKGFTTKEFIDKPVDALLIDHLFSTDYNDKLRHDFFIERHLRQSSLSLARIYQIWTDNFHLISRSATAPHYPLTHFDPGLSTVITGGVSWRVYTLKDEESGFYYVIGQRSDQRSEMICRSAASQILPLFIIFPLFAALLWTVIGHALRPLREFSHTVDHIDPANLPTLSSHALPIELKPIAETLTALFASVHASFEREKRFSADAAHELRTPLAASKTLAQLARSTDDIRLCHEYLDDILKGLDRGAHIVAQLQILNSMQPDSILQLRSDIDIHRTVESIIKDLRLISDKKAHIDNTVAHDLEVYANEWCIQILLRNLIDNAIRYSGIDPQVTVSGERKGDDIYLAVTDRGLGIPVALRYRVLDRFYRELGTGQSGCGLGLSIAALICQIHGGEITLHEGPDGVGLRVLCRLPIHHPSSG